MPLTRRFILVAALLALALPANAANYNKHANSAYLAAEAVSPLILPAPAMPGSKEFEKELKAVIKAQKDASKKDLAAARAEAPVTPEMITSVLGPKFTRANLPATFALLDKVGKDTGKITHHAKDFWKLPRPFRVAPDKVKSLLEKEIPADNYAYPSGHTSASAVWAEVLAALAPKATEKLRARAEEIAYHRVQVGVHYPQDLTGGRALTFAILAKLEKSAKYQADFAAAKAELAACR